MHVLWRYENFFCAFRVVKKYVAKTMEIVIVIMLKMNMRSGIAGPYLLHFYSFYDF